MEEKNYCEPIKTFEEAMQYNHLQLRPIRPHNFPQNSHSYANNKHDCHVEGNELVSRKFYPTNIVPKTLICHDMKGGYLEDKYIYGCSTGNGYTFYRWSNIDIFVYFSHHLVTIPPIGWIQLAHSNNVKILGTLITEFNEGKLICEKIFRTNDSWRNFADALVNICLTYKFDGYLLNIENDITNPETMIKFVTYLTSEIKNISPDFMILWYDSVTIEGKLKWQNELNNLNKPYFDACDGIFLNYTWKESNLQNSVENAAGRFLDVYVGVDVFGRNFLGGGGFNCDKAIQIIRKLGLSMAIFAQGWTHETLRPKTLDNFYDMFLYRDNAFWLKLYPYLYTRPADKCFSTTFYTGSDKHNYHLDLQEKLLDLPVHSGPTYFSDECKNFCNCLQMYHSGCKANRFSYLITCCKLKKENNYIHRLFLLNIFVENSLVIKTITREGNRNNNFALHVLLEDSEKKLHSFKLDKYVKPTDIPNNFNNVKKNWKFKEFSVSAPQMTLKEIGVTLDNKSLLLGGISIETKNCQPEGTIRNDSLNLKKNAGLINELSMIKFSS